MTGSSRYQPGNAGGRARDGVEAPVRPVLSGRGGLRQRLGMVVVAAVAISVLAAGIGLGEQGLGPTPSGSDASLASSVSGSPRPPTSAPEATPLRTGMNGSECIPADPADLPRVFLDSTGAGDSRANGLPGPVDWALATPQTLAWPIPPSESALILESSAEIAVVPNERACIRHVVAEYLAVEDIGGVATALGPGEIDVFPAQPEVVLGAVPTGDWLVRVAVHLATGPDRDDDEAIAERFYRVTTSVNPGVSPEVTPAVPCATLEPGETVGLSLQIGEGQPVPGVDLDTYAGNIAQTGALVEGSGVDPLVLSVDGDACATSWIVQWLDTSGSAMLEVRQDNRSENPFLVSQNRMVLVPEQDVFGHIALSATVQLGLGRTVRAAWELERTGPPLPPIQVAGPDGVAVDGIPGCGAGWNFGDGRSTYEQCEQSFIPETVRLLAIRAGDVVDILAPGLTVESWSAACGTRGGNQGNEFMYTCDLGGGPSNPMRFLPYPGRSMIQIYVGMQVDDDHFYAPYFVEILAER